MGNRTSKSTDSNNSNGGRSGSGDNASANVDDIFIETDEEAEMEREMRRDHKKVSQRYFQCFTS